MAPTLLCRAALLLVAALVLVLAVGSPTAGTAVPSRHADVAPSEKQRAAVHAAPTLASVRAAAVNFDIDVNGLINTIAGAISASKDRGAFVRSTLDKVRYYRMKNGRQVISDYNVMVFNRQVRHSSRLRGVELYRDFQYQGITYGVWIFDSGWFRNEGDGGWINWAFSGSFDRDGGYVKFRSRK